jgi:CheY-like chemotaxis protein
MPSKTILVIENDDVTRTAFEIILNRHGYVVALAENGTRGLLYLQSHDQPDLIILDMMMKGMDGWQLLKYRNRRWRSVPVLIVTALPAASDEWAASLGAFGWLEKPIEESALVQKIAQCLQAPALIG